MHAGGAAFLGATVQALLRESVVYWYSIQQPLHRSGYASQRPRGCVVFVCKYVLGHSRVSQPLNLRLCLLRHVGFLTSPHASPTCRRRRLNSYRLLRRSTPGPTLFEGAKGERFRQVQLCPGVRRTKGKLLRLFVYEDDLATGGYQSVQSMNVLKVCDAFE
jgi:hypothetical protein